MLGTGHAAAFRTRFGRHKTGPLITDIASSPMKLRGRIVGLTQDCKPGPSDQIAFGSWNRTSSRRSRRPKEAGRAADLFRLAIAEVLKALHLRQCWAHRPAQGGMAALHEPAGLAGAASSNPSMALAQNQEKTDARTESADRGGAR
jgi:hypothetical protein